MPIVRKTDGFYVVDRKTRKGLCGPAEGRAALVKLRKGQFLKERLRRLEEERRGDE